MATIFDSPIAGNDTDGSDCGQDALTNSYGWLIQGILAILVFGLLVGKLLYMFL